MIGWRKNALDIVFILCSFSFMAVPHSIFAQGNAPIDLDQAYRLNAPPTDDLLSFLERQQKQLARLTEIGCRMADAFDPWSQNEDTKISAAARAAGFARLTDAIRKLMALEQYTSGIRDNRFKFVRRRWLEGREKAVRQSVEQALTVSKPEIEPKKRENLLGDLFRDYNVARFENGNLRNFVAEICETLGVTADLSIWDEPAAPPAPTDMVLPAGHSWIAPQNGDRPYTFKTRPDGKRIRIFWDAPELQNYGPDPPAMPV
jgi:hypothetical protein